MLSKEKADAILKISIAISALCIGLGVGFYFGVWVPQRERDAIQAEKTASAAKLADEQRKEKEKAASQEAQRNNYNICISTAEEKYNDRWERSCKTQSDNDLEIKKNCISNGLNFYYCNNIKIRPSSNCTLPRDLAESYEQDMQNEKNLCLEKTKSGL